MTDRAAGVPFAKEGFPFIGAAAGITLIAGGSVGYPGGRGGHADPLRVLVFPQPAAKGSPRTWTRRCPG